MGAGAENIAIGITTTAELSGITQTTAGLGALGKTAAGLATNVNAQIGAFEALGKKVDVTNVAAVQGYRAQGDALAGNLVKLGATDAEINRLNTSIGKVERAAGASLLNPASPQTLALSALPNKTRTAASAFGILAQSAVTGSGSIAGLGMAVGNLSVGLSSLATSAKAVAAATWITLLIQLAATAMSAFEGWKTKTRELGTQLGDLQSAGRGIADTLGGADLAAKLEAINHAADDEIKKVKEVGLLEKTTDLAFTEHARQRTAIAAALNTNRDKAIALAKTQYANEVAARAKEKADQIAGGALALSLEQDRATGQQTEYNLTLTQYETERRQRATEIQQSFVRRDAAGAIIALTADEIVQLNILLDQNNKLTIAKEGQLTRETAIAREQQKAAQLQASDTVGDRVGGRLAEIELERVAQIKATGDVYTATLSAEQKKRLLYRQTAAEANTNAKTIFDILRSTNDKTLKAVGTFGENLRRVVIGAEAAKALVRAAVEGAEAIASLAAGDFRGAALHGAAALEFGSAAALGARESLGGGGGGGGGGSSGGGGGGSTFTPKEHQGGGTTVVNLYTTDPYSREGIMIASYQLQRAGITKRPIYIPPTTGLVPQGA